jgi:hypothetical protein
MRVLDLDVPPEVMEAAWTVANWARKNGFKNWMIGPVADRNYLQRILDAVNHYDPKCT